MFTKLWCFGFETETSFIPLMEWMDIESGECAWIFTKMREIHFNFLIMPTNKTYEITTLEHISNIATKENILDLLTAFSVCMDIYIQTIEKFRKENPKISKGKSNHDLVHFGFNWTDDGENKITGIKFKNKETGECFINTPK